MRKFCIVFPALLLVGCYNLGILPLPENTVKKVADSLGRFPVGTPFATVFGDPELSRLNFEKPKTARFITFACMAFNPLDKELVGLQLYRQVPTGVLLTIRDDDLKSEVAVSERIDADQCL